MPKEKLDIHKLKLNIKLSDKQKKILSDCSLHLKKYDTIVVSTGRQVGKTTIGIITALKWIFGRKNYQIGFFSPTHRQALNVFNRFKKILKPFERNNMVSFRTSPDTYIEFWDGSKIQFFTSDNDNMRGYTFDSIIIDEACFIKDDIFNGGILPTVSISLGKGKGKMLLLSTPKEKNYFYKLVNDPSNKTAVHRFTSEEGGLISKDLLTQLKKTTPSYIYKNEYEGQFIESGQGIFKYTNSVQTEPIADMKGFVAGLDIGSSDDYTVLTIMNKKGDVILMNRWRQLELNQICDLVMLECKRYGKPLLYVETNGIGKMPYEYLKQNYKRVKPFHTTQNNKSDMINQLMVDMNQQLISIPDKVWLLDELDNFGVVFKNGKPKYSGMNGSHDDAVMSLSICNYHRNKIDTTPIKIDFLRKKSLM